MNHAAQERTCGQNNRASGYLSAITQTDTCNGPLSHHEIDDLAKDDLKPFLLRQHRPHGVTVKLPISLGSGTLHRRTLAPIQQTKLNAGPVRDTAHDSVQGIDFSYKMPFSKPSDRRVAGHCADITL